MDSSQTLFIVVDESGNFDFSPSGTRHLVLSAVATHSPVATAIPILSLRYELLSNHVDVRDFHASADSQHVRNRVLWTISQNNEHACHAITCTKGELDESLRTRESAFAHLAERVLTSALAEKTEVTTRIVLIFDIALPNKERGLVRSKVVPLLKKTTVPFAVYFQSMKHEPIGQIADYYAWAMYVQLERGEERPWLALQGTGQRGITRLKGDRPS